MLRPAVRPGAVLRLALALGASGLAPPVRAEEPARPLLLTVHPSGTEEAGSLDERLARRMRDADYLFRHICRGCARGEGGSAAPFEPLATLQPRARSRDLRPGRQAETAPAAEGEPATALELRRP